MDYQGKRPDQVRYREIVGGSAALLVILILLIQLLLNAIGC